MVPLLGDKSFEMFGQNPIFITFQRGALHDANHYSEDYYISLITKHTISYSDESLICSNHAMLVINHSFIFSYNSLQCLSTQRKFYGQTAVIPNLQGLYSFCIQQYSSPYSPTSTTKRTRRIKKPKLLKLNSQNFQYQIQDVFIYFNKWSC